MNYVTCLPKIVSKRTDNIFEGSYSEVKTPISGRSVLLYWVKVDFIWMGYLKVSEQIIIILLKEQRVVYQQ